MTTETKPSKFKSQFKGFQKIVRGRRDQYHPVTGAKIGEVKELVAEFGVHSGEYQVEDPISGEILTFADIRGGYYDLDSDAEQKGWTEDEKESVRASLINLSHRWPQACQVYESPKAPIPWPTYDTAHHSKVAQLAADLGLAAEALQYEQENKNRPSVVEDLTKIVVAQQTEQVEELTAS